MSHIFVCHSHQDREYALKLADELRKKDFDPWIDKDNLGPGDRWSRGIFAAIKGCAAFIVLMTPDADTSQWVETEIQLAQKQGKQIFPLLLKGEEFDLLITLQYEDVRDGAFPSEVFYQRLQRAVDLEDKQESDPQEEIRQLKAYVAELEQMVGELEEELDAIKLAEENAMYDDLRADAELGAWKDSH